MRRTSVFLGGQAVSMLGDGVAVLAIPLLVLQVTRSPVAAALAAAPRSIGYLLVGVAAGVVADRVDPLRVLVAADTLRAAIFLALFVLSGLHIVVVPVVLALAFGAGAATVFFDTALSITLRDVFAGPRLVAANSWLESANQGGQVIGPGIAGLLAALGVLPVAMLLDALTFIVSLASLAAVRRRTLPPRHRAAASCRKLAHELAEGIRYVAATRLFRTMTLLVLVLNFCLGADKLIVFFARETLQLPGWQVGLLVTGGGAGGILGAASAPRLCRRLGPLPMITVCMAASGFALLMMSAATLLPLAAAANVLYVWAIIAASVMLRVVRQALVPRELLGRVMAATRLAGQAATAVGAVAAAALTSLLAGNPRPVFAAAGAVSILAVTLAWVVSLRHEEAAAAAVLISAPAR